MIRLLRAELLRLRSRKLAWIALGAVLLVVALTQIAVYTSVRPLSDSERAQAQTAYEQQHRDWEQHKDQYAQDAQECVNQGNPPEACEYPEPKLEDFAQRSVSTFSEITGTAVTVGVFVTALALLFVSASMIGAEFSSGSLANWLSFVPERTRVYVSKLAALLLVGAVVTAFIAALTIGAAAVLSSIAGADVTQVGKVAAMGGRGVAVGVVAVVIGFALALLTRHTIAAAGTVLGYLFLSFVLNIVSFAVPALQSVKRLLPENNALALLNKGHTYVTYNPVETPDGQYEENMVEHVITIGQSSLYWVVVVAVLLAVTYLVFRRRDVN